MERFIVINWAVLCVAVLIFEIVLAEPYHDSRQLTMDKKGGEGLKQSYMWFGPRLGRKKRNTPNNDVYQNTGHDELATLLDVIEDTPWALVAVNEGKRHRHVVNFTPRLGRESGEESTNGLPGDWLLQDPEEFLTQRSPPFAPRLGRHLSPFSPRLGRNNEKIPFSPANSNL